MCLACVIRRQMEAQDDLLASLKACHAYFGACAAQWAQGEGRIVEGQQGAVVIGANLDVLGDAAAEAVIKALAKAEGSV